MKKPATALFALLLGITFAFTGCASASGQTGTSSQKAQIRLSTWAGSDESKQLQTIIDGLNTKSKTYQIVQESNPADYETRIKTQLSSAGGPDLFWVSAQDASQLASRGAMLDITQRLNKSKTGAANVSDYTSGTLNAFTVKNKIYGLPWCAQPIVVYYNENMFQKAGLSDPSANWNWNDFLNDAKKLTLDKNGRSADQSGFDKNNTVQYGTTLNGWPPVQMFIWQNGGEVITKDFKDSPIDSAAAIGGLKFYADLIKSPEVPSQQTIKDRGFDTMFKQGQVAMFMGGAADSIETQVSGFTCKLAVVPQGPTGIQATFEDEYGMAVNAKSKHADAAYQALIDLTQAIQEWKMVPPRKSMDTETELEKLHPDRKAAIPVILDSVKIARPYRYYKNYADWDNVFENQILDKIINGQGDPATLAKQNKAALKATLPQ